MNRRLLIILVFLVILIGVGAAFLLPTLNRSASNTNQTNTGTGQATIAPAVTPLPSATPMPMTNLVIAVQQIPRGVAIQSNAVDLRPWPEVAAPQNSITSLEDVIGKIARTDIFREQPILSTMLVEDLTNLARVGSDAAAVLPSGFVAVAVPMDRLTSVAYGIQDGDRVNIIVSLLFVDVDEAFQTLQPNLITLFSVAEDGGLRLGATIQGRPEITSLGQGIISPSEAQRPRLVTQQTIQDALVVHVGDFPIDGKLFRYVPPTPTPAPTAEGQAAQQAARQPTAAPTAVPPRPDIITLGVTPQDAVVLTWFIEARLPITFALRSAKDTSRVPTDPVTLDYVMTQYGISLPGKTNFSIQPAIRSIRQLIAENQISLSN